MGSTKAAPNVQDLLLGNVDVHFARLGGVAAAVGDLSTGVISSRIGAEGGTVQTVVQRLRFILGDTRDNGFQDVGGPPDAAGATAPSVLRFQRCSAFASSATADALSSEPPCERRAHIFRPSQVPASAAERGQL